MGFYKTFPKKKEHIDRSSITCNPDYIGFTQYRSSIKDVTNEFILKSRGVVLKNGNMLICDEDGSVWVYAEIVSENLHVKKKWIELNYIVDVYNI